MQRRNGTTGKRGEANEFDPAEMLDLYEHARKSALQGQVACAIALAGPFVKSKDASERREQ
jgi:hypothetical protein